MTEWHHWPRPDGGRDAWRVDRLVELAEGLPVVEVEVDSINEVFRLSNAVSVHVSATDVYGRSNEGLLEPGHFAQLGADAPEGPRLFVNLARGFLYEPSALIEAVEQGAVQYGFVDVFPDEPRHANDAEWRNPYEGNERIMATPHIGGNTTDVAAHQGLIVVQELTRMLRGERPRHVLNPEALSGFSWSEPRPEPPPDLLATLGDGPGPAVTDLERDKDEA